MLAATRDGGVDVAKTAAGIEARAAERSSARDVARLAGVSTATVSRALNIPASVDPATLSRVRAAIEKLRYVPHGAARALRSRKSEMIGAVVPSFDYALYARTTSALQREADARGYALVLAAHHYDLATEVRVTQQMVQHGVDAFVFVGLDHDAALYSLLDNYGRPYVLTWGVDPSGLHPSIGFDNRAATYAMTQHLIGLGHRHFGLISAPTAGNDRSRRRDCRSPTRTCATARSPSRPGRARCTSCSRGGRARPPCSPRTTSSPSAR